MSDESTNDDTANEPTFHDEPTFHARCGTIHVHGDCPEDLPRCVLAMGCLCVGHAAGYPADAECDTDEARVQKWIAEQAEQNDDGSIEPEQHKLGRTFVPIHDTTVTWIEVPFAYDPYWEGIKVHP